MKKIILTTLIIGWLFTAQSQVAGLKFKGTMNIPDPTNCILSFAKDTLYLINDQDRPDMARGEVIETMTYTVKNNTLILQKVTGLSPCDNTIPGTYKLEEDISFNANSPAALQTDAYNAGFLVDKQCL